MKRITSETRKLKHVSVSNARVDNILSEGRFEYKEPEHETLIRDLQAILEECEVIINTEKDDKSHIMAVFVSHDSAYGSSSISIDAHIHNKASVGSIVLNVTDGRYPIIRGASSCVYTMLPSSEEWKHINSTLEALSFISNMSYNALKSNFNIENDSDAITLYVYLAVLDLELNMKG